MTEPASETGPGVTYLGVVEIEWPPAPGPSQPPALPCWQVAVRDAHTGRAITTVTSIQLRTPPNGLITVDLTMFAGEDGQPVYSERQLVKGSDGKLLTGVFPFLVSAMRVRPARAR
jgi:hypothetical protein